MTEEPQGSPAPQPSRFDSAQRTLAIVLLSIVVPVIGYIIYGQYIYPRLQTRQTNPSGIQDALIQSQIEATARAEVWQVITAEAIAAQEADAMLDFRTSIAEEARATVSAEIEATLAAEALQEATLAAVRTQAAFDAVVAQGTLVAEAQTTAVAIAAATLDAYRAEQDELVNIRVLATVQSLYEGDAVLATERANNRTLLIVGSATAAVAGGAALVWGLTILARPRSRRDRRSNHAPREKKQLPSPEYATVRCSCKGEQVLCHQCEGTGEVLYTDADTNRYMYRYCPRCNGTGYCDCDICAGRGLYYREGKAIEMESSAAAEDSPEPTPAAGRQAWSARIRAFFSLIDHIASNQRVDP